MPMTAFQKTMLANSALAAAFGAWGASSYKQSWKKGALYGAAAGLVLNATVVGGVVAGKKFGPKKGYMGQAAGAVVGVLAAPTYNKFLADQWPTQQVRVASSLPALPQAPTKVIIRGETTTIAVEEKAVTGFADYIRSARGPWLRA